MKILFYCQYLLGMGHYVRSLALVDGLKDQEVFFVNGGVPIMGMPVPADIILHQLHPIRSDENFAQLITQDEDDFRERRAQQLLELYHQVQPDVIMIELFPFGRKKFEFELIPLLETNLYNPNKAQVVCSLRDILVKKENPDKFEKRVCRLVDKYFDKILVHSDPQIFSLETSFSRVNELQAGIFYTGYVVPQNGHAQPEVLPEKESTNSIRIVVSAGGGRVGFPLLKTAVEAHQFLDSDRPVEMTLITGPFLPEEQRRQLDVMTADNPNIKIKSFVPNLCGWMRSADLSISMAGYNTCLDILQAGVPALLIPFNGGGNDEQLRRAAALASLDAAVMLSPEDLNPKKLALAIHAALKLSPGKVDLNLAGVQETRRIIFGNAA